MIELPTPSIDMCDGAAATFLDQLADMYTGIDASHVRSLAARLRRQHDETIEAAAKARAKEREDLVERRATIDDERKDLAKESDDVERKIREMKRA